MDEYSDDTKIFLVMAGRDKRAVGFGDTKRSFTFAFTTEAKAEAFLKASRSVGMMLDADTLYAMTVGEYFEWKKNGKASADLTIDPDTELFTHSLFEGHRYTNN